MEKGRTGINSNKSKLLGKFNIIGTEATFTLSDDATKYNALLVTYYQRGVHGFESIVIPATALIDVTQTKTWYMRDVANVSNYATLTYVDATHVKLVTTASGNKFVTVVGV